jgi:hypothetical protein
MQHFFLSHNGYTNFHDHEKITLATLIIAHHVDNSRANKGSEPVVESLGSEVGIARTDADDVLATAVHVTWNGYSDTENKEKKNRD